MLDVKYTKINKKHIRQFWNSLTIIFLVFSLYWIYQVIDIKKIPNIISSVNLPYLVPAILAYPLSICVSTLRWRLFFPKNNRSHSFGNLLKLYWTSSVYSQFLPGGHAGDLVKFIAMNSVLGKRKSLSSIFNYRLSGIVALLVAVFWGAIYNPSLLNQVIDSRILIATTLSLLLFILMMPKIVNLFVSKIFNGKSGFEHSYVWKQPNWWLSTGLSISLICLNILTTYFAFFAFGVEVGIFNLVLIMPLINLLGILPLPLSGLGVHESVAVVLFSEVLILPEVVLSLMLTFRIIKIFVDVFGLGILYISDFLNKPI